MDKWKSLRAQFRYHYKKRDSFVDWKYAQDMAFLEQHIRWGRKSISFNQSNDENGIIQQQENGHYNKTVANSPFSPRLRAKSSQRVSKEDIDQVSSEKPLSLIWHRLLAYNQKINHIFVRNSGILKQNLKSLIGFSILMVCILMILFYFHSF